jgi:hypothetical protein
MGFTWTTIGVLVNYFLFYPEAFSSMMISRNEGRVETRGDPDCLFWKFDYLIKDQPLWLLPQRDWILARATKLHRENPENGAVCDGEATTQHMSAGGRRNVIFLDEFARVERGLDTKALSATRDATNCRIFGSTSEGRGTEFYNIEHSHTTACVYIHWSKHPENGRGLYKERADGSIELLDDFKGRVRLYRGVDEKKNPIVEYYDYPDDYPFTDAVNDKAISHEYRIRSPWFDSQCNRRPSVQEIAQQLEMNDGKAGDSFFDDMVLERIMEEYCKNATHIGKLHYSYNPHSKTVQLHEEAFRESPERGFLQIWGQLNSEGKLPQMTNYVIGCDISRGNGASNSTMAVYDVNTAEQVAEAANPNMSPDAFAQFVVAFCKWIGGVRPPVLNVEVNGPGALFVKEVSNLGYPHIYMGSRKTTSDKYGWHSNPKSKLALFGDMRSALARGELLPKSRLFVEECREYVQDSTGKLVIARVADKSSGAREAHGDRVVAHATAFQALQTATPVHNTEYMADPPWGSMAWLEQRERRLKSEDALWDPIIT